MIELRVVGIPGPQGSKKLVGHSKVGRGILVESSAKVKPWREAVKMAAVENGARVEGPIAVMMLFILPRPKSAKNGAVPAKRPDISKLARSTEDALVESGIIEDDSRIIEEKLYKAYVGDERALTRVGISTSFDRPGAIIQITRQG